MSVLMRCVRCRKLSPKPRCEDCKRKYARQPVDSFYRTSKWKKLADACKRRDKTCAICGTDKGLIAHHVIPRKAGGMDALGNLIALCIRCHNQIERDISLGLDTERRRLIESGRPSPSRDDPPTVA
jgi:5-methylcytosine-specific restriction endonuclease McrA